MKTPETSTPAATVTTPLAVILSGQWPTNDKDMDKLIVDIGRDRDLTFPRHLPMSQRQKFRNFVEDVMVERMEKMTGSRFEVDGDYPDDDEDLAIEICTDYMRKAQLGIDKTVVDNLARIVVEYLA